MSNRPIFTVRTTAVEAFRLWYYGQTEDNESWNTEEKVIATVEGRYVANVKADFGTAGHAIIEDPTGTCKDGKFVYKNFTFTPKQAEPLLRYAAWHPLMIREMPVSKLYGLKDFDLIITGTVDALEGNVMRDNKFKFSQFSMEEYLDSVQHRLYMDMMGMEIFYYDFFRVKGFEFLADAPKAVISDVESMRVTAYGAMQEDIYEILNEFAGWIKHHRLQPVLTLNEYKTATIIAGNSEFKKILRF